ncbi:hypothetical protein DAH66_13875 [Sphingomonas koreensis]|uniref:Uncharacterized protein n=1 Tax=Sphingomonas koreensis TaxID=93064 RepID=A0A430G1X1_9SPHN|nr:hypothetical protein [Sphingomonas koreensis]RSY81957.1 hypothetical protein DAH66_13875 [Sphingomonas koreensis]
MSSRPRTRSARSIKVSARGMAIAAATVLLAGGATLNAIANITRTKAPETALGMPFGGDPTAAAPAIDNLTRTDPEALTRPDVAVKLKAALRLDPLDASAIRNLGFVAELGRDRERARKLINLAERVSRRDAATQIWLIEDAARNGDVARTLRHYDIALKTSLEVQPLLFGTLANALSEPQVARALVPLIRPRPSWLYAFVAQTIESGANLTRLQRVIQLAGGLPDTAEFQALETRFIQRLVELRAFDAAGRLYAEAAGPSRSAASVTGFTHESTDPRFAPYTWQTFGNAGTGVGFEDGGKGLAARIIANSNSQTTVLRRVFSLAPGSYRFALRRELIYATPRTRAVWALRCNGAQTASQSWQEPVTRITVSAGCAHQVIELDVWGEDDENGAQIVLSGLSITPLR